MKGSIRQRGERWQLVINTPADGAGRRQRCVSFDDLDDAYSFAEQWDIEIARRPTGPDVRADDGLVAGVVLTVDELIARAGSVSQLALLVGVHRKTVYLAMRDGVSVFVADEWACRLGHHPANVWGDSWWQALDEIHESGAA